MQLAKLSRTIVTALRDFGCCIPANTNSRQPSPTSLTLLPRLPGRVPSEAAGLLFAFSHAPLAALSCCWCSTDPPLSGCVLLQAWRVAARTSLPEESRFTVTRKPWTAAKEFSSTTKAALLAREAAELGMRLTRSRVACKVIWNSM